MPKQFGYVPVDRQKFMRILHKRNIGMNAMSLEMGRAHNYITECLRRERFTGAAVAALKNMYNINPEDYAPDAEAAPEPAPEPLPVDPINYDKLYNIIYHAVYEAVKKAWSE